MQFQSAFRDHTARHHLDIADTARMFAAGNASATDAVVTAWDAKLHYGFWRPITAVQLADTDGNPATEADPQWQPLLVTPPHPDYLSGHTTVAGAVIRTLTGILGTTHIDLNVPSEITGTTRHYAEAGQFNEDMINARVWAGIHFRTADVVGCRAGTRIGVWALAHYFTAASGGSARHAAGPAVVPARQRELTGPLSLADHRRQDRGRPARVCPAGRPAGRLVRQDVPTAFSDGRRELPCRRRPVRGRRGELRVGFEEADRDCGGEMQQGEDPNQGATRQLAGPEPDRATSPPHRHTPREP